MERNILYKKSSYLDEVACIIMDEEHKGDLIEVFTGFPDEVVIRYAKGRAIPVHFFDDTSWQDCTEGEFFEGYKKFTAYNDSFSKAIAK